MTPESIRATLREAGLTQLRFALLCGMTHHTLSRVMRGLQPVPARVVIMARLVAALHRRRWLARILEEIGV